MTNKLFYLYLLRKLLFITFIVILYKTTNSENRLPTIVFNTLCSDGEVSEGASSELIKFINNDPYEFVNKIQYINSDFKSRPKYRECYLNIRNSYERPEFYNALITSIRSEYGEDHLSLDLALKLQALRNHLNNRELDYFVGQLLLI